MLATFAVPLFGAGNEAEVAFWRFKVSGVKRFAKSGGMLSIMSAGFEEDMCHNCDLNACQDSSDGGDTCTFMVHLKGGSKYTLVLYGISRVEKKGDAVSVTWKPPSNCYQKLDCVNYGDPCTKVSNDDMEWQPVKHGPWTYLVCRTSYNARLLSTNVDTKPFCLDSSEFSNMESCWPDSEETDAAGTSCAGTYTVEQADALNVMLGKRNADVTDVKYQVSVDDDGSCNFTDTSGAAQLTSRRSALLRFDEGPCDGSDSQASLEAAEAASLGAHGVLHRFQRHTRAGRLVRHRRERMHRGASVSRYPSSAASLGASALMRCSGKTATHDASVGTDGDTLKFKVDRTTGKSSIGLSEAKTPNKVTVDKENLNVVRPGHTGDFHYAFTPHTLSSELTTSVDSDGVMSQDAFFLRIPLPDATSESGGGTFSTWMRKSAAGVVEGGEALFSVTYRDVLTPGYTQEFSQGYTTYMKMLIMPGGSLRFESRIARTPLEQDRDRSNKKLTCAYITKVFTAESSKMPEIFDGEWHRVTFAVTEAKVKFFIDDGAEEAEVDDEAPKTSVLEMTLENDDMDCPMNPPSSGTPADADMGTEKQAENLEFGYRDGPAKLKFFGAVFVGAAYDADTDQIVNAYLGSVDSVATYERRLSDVEIAMLGADLPCAVGFQGSSFAYFPGFSSTRGTESVSFNAGQCNAGQHTVRFRYLTGQGNDAELKVEPAAGSVVFTEPRGFEDSLDDWRTTDPLLVTAESGVDLKVKLSSDMNTRRRAMSRRRMLAVGALDDSAHASLGYSDSPIDSTEANSVRVNVDAIATWIGMNLDNSASPPFPPPRASPPPSPPPSWINLDWQCFIKGTTSGYQQAPNRRRNLLGGSLNDTFPSGSPPAPSQDWLDHEEDLEKASDAKLNLIGTPFSCQDANHEKISHMACNYQRWNVVLDSVWQRFRSWTSNSEKGAGYYRVTGEAGKKLLYVKESDETAKPRIPTKENPHPQGGIPMSPACGYKFPGRIVTYENEITALESANGNTKFDVCFSSATDTCFIRKTGMMYVCNEDAPVYKLPQVTGEDIMSSEAIPSFSIKISRLDTSLGKVDYPDVVEEEESTIDQRRKLLGGGDYEVDEDYEAVDRDGVGGAMPEKTATTMFIYCRAPEAYGNNTIDKNMPLVLDKHEELGITHTNFKIATTGVNYNFKDRSYNGGVDWQRLEAFNEQIGSLLDGQMVRRCNFFYFFFRKLVFIHKPSKCDHLISLFCFQNTQLAPLQAGRLDRVRDQGSSMD
jgi:hypothetical protein